MRNAAIRFVLKPDPAVLVGGLRMLRDHVLIYVLRGQRYQPRYHCWLCQAGRMRFFDMTDITKAGGKYTLEGDM